jgi:hypothetical protein
MPALLVGGGAVGAALTAGVMYRYDMLDMT